MMNPSEYINNLNIKSIKITVTVHDFGTVSIIQPGEFSLKWAIKIQVNGLVLMNSYVCAKMSPSRNIFRSNVVRQLEHTWMDNITGFCPQAHMH